MTDRLNDMFRMQYELQVGTYGNQLHEMSDRERIEFIKNNILAATDELHEAMAETGWKPWASSNHVNGDAYFNELIDLWHFVMNLMLATGHHPDWVAEQMYERYIAKRNKNIKRQQDGYDGISGKCPACRRAYDDVAVYCTAVRADHAAWCDMEKRYVP